jgi:hypothetical protein
LVNIRTAQGFFTTHNAGIVFMLAVLGFQASKVLREEPFGPVRWWRRWKLLVIMAMSKTPIHARWLKRELPRVVYTTRRLDLRRVVQCTGHARRGGSVMSMSVVDRLRLDSQKLFTEGSVETI